MGQRLEVGSTSLLNYDFRWATGAVYKTGQLVVNSSQPYIAVDDHTAGATFGGDAAHWTLVVPGIEIVSVELTTNHTISTTTFANVVDTGAGSANWAITIPANMGAIVVEIPSVLLIATTGSGTVAGTSYNTQLEIVDEADARVAHGEIKPYSTATAVQTPGGNIPVASGVIANNGSIKTYRVRAAMQQAGTNSAAGTVNTSSGGVTKNPRLLARRV